jgi:hypothetical protein
VARAQLRRPEDVVRLLCAVQAQDYAGAKWSLGQRTRNGTDRAIDQAFNSGKVLRTHVLRPTWHFVTPVDIRWMLQLTAPHVHALNAYYYRKLELDPALFRRSDKLLMKALEGDKHRTRAELAAALSRGGIIAAGPRLAYIVAHAELEGLICSGPLRGKQHTYSLLEERVPAAPTLTRDEALAELALRFFTGHSPATLRHFAWWSGLPMADARAGLAMIRGRLTARRDGPLEWLGIPGSAGERPPMAAYLLPEYDEALVGGKDFGAIDLTPAARRGPWKDAYLRPVIIAGKRAGTWKRTVTRGRAVLEANLFARLTPSQSRALQAAAVRYGTFLELPVSLTP